MNFNVNERLLLSVKHGSHAYGLNTPTSDLDIKGICIEPKEYFFGFAKNFEQHIQEASKGYEHDLVIYSFKKFAKLATECNPTIVECLFVQDEDILFCNKYGQEIRDFRQNFLSSKAKHTFLGFAHSQLKRIKTHRAWLRNPPSEPPSRKEFGLPETMGMTKAEIGAFEALEKRAMVEELSKEAIVLYTKEKAYKNKKAEWDSYQTWLRQRNPVRAEMEAKYGFDCYSADTEFLTNVGWKHFDSITDDDELATVRIEEGRKDIPVGTVEYQQPVDKFDSSYNGPMYNIVAYHTDISVTANHQMLVRPKSRRLGTTGDLTLMPASHLEDNFDIMVTPNPQTRSWKLPKEVKECGIPCMALMRLMGWYLTDGTMQFRDGKPRTIAISQKKGGRLCCGMTKFSNKYPNCSLYKYQRKPTEVRPYEIEEQVLHVRIPEIVDLLYKSCGHGTKVKRIPRWVFNLSASRLSILFHEMIKADGTIREHKTIDPSSVLYTINKGLADDVQELAILCGWQSSIYGPYEHTTELGTHMMYQVHVQPNSKQYRSLIRSHNVRKENVCNHRVVCFTVPNGTLITRRNGHVAIQGNCKFGLHMIRLYRTCKELLETGQLNVKRTWDREDLLSIRTGGWTFERLVEEAERLDAECDELYKTSMVLPKSPNVNKIDAFVIDLTERYLKENG